MSWSQWASTAVTAQSTQNAVALPSTSSEPAAVSGASAPFGGGMPPPTTSYTPAQFAALSPQQQYALQQNWQQWQTYHQQYAQWHAQYGEQYQREMQAKLGMVAPSLPFVPPMPPYAAPVPPAIPLSYTVPPPPPTQAPSVINAPNISVIAAQPPPPPPPPEDTTNKVAKASLPQFFNQNHEQPSPQCNQNQQQPLPLFNKSQIQLANPQNMPSNQNQNSDYITNQQKKGYNSNELSRKQNNESRNFNSERRNYNDSNRHNYTDHYNRNSSDRSGFDADNRNRSPWQSNQQPFGNQQQHSQPHQLKQEQPFVSQKIEPEIEKDSQKKVTSNDEKTPEDRIFDEQFQKWEEEFRNWKRQNANHPDKKGYIEYEMKFLETRRKLLERREVVKKRNLERLLNEGQECESEKSQKSEASVKSAEKVKEQNHDKVITRNEPLKTNDPLPVQTIVDQQQNKPPTESSEELIPAEEPQEVVEFLKPSKVDGGIPGLDLVTAPEQNPDDAFEDVTEVIDLEADQKGDQVDRKAEVANVNITNVNVSQTLQHINSASVYPYLRKEIPSLMSQKFEKPSLSPSPSPTMLQNTNSNGAEASDCRIESFGQFMDNNLKNPIEENSLSNHSGNNANSDASDKGNIPPVMAELANALSDPNVLALLTAAMGGQASGGGQFGNQGGMLRSPWMTGKEPFQEKNRSFRDNAPVGNINDFGGNQNNSWDFRGGPSGGNKWQDNNRNSNQSWGNRNMNNNRGNYHLWSNRQNRPDDNRRGGYQNWFNRDRDGRRNNRWQQDDTDPRDDIERNIDSTDVVNERGDIMEQRGDKFNPFKDHDERSGGQMNSIENNRGRCRNRDNESNYNDDGLQHVNRDRSRSSGRSGYFDSSGRQDDNNSAMGSAIRNPFKIESNAFDKQMDSMQSGNDNFFQPAHVIDYQNRPLGGISSNSDILFPTKVVDYGHKPSGGVNERNVGNQGINEFFPMKTIDYGHSSVTNDIQRNNEGKNSTAFQGGGGRGRNRNRFRNKKSTVLNNDQHFAGVSSCENDIIPQSPGWPTNIQENTEQIIQCSKENEIEVDQNYSETAATNECFENFEELSEDDNDFDDIKSSRVSDFDQTSTIPTPLSDENNKTSVFPIKNMYPPKQIKKTISLKFPTMENNNTITIDEILLKPGRYSRSKKIVIILRGPPGSGKSFVAKLIKDKEVEMGGSAPRLLSIDDYFMTEIDAEEMCPNTGKKVKREDIVYKYEKEMESKYMQCLIKAFKKTVKDHLFDFVIVDCVNESLRSFTEFYNNAKTANFTPYTIDLLCDLETCLSRNIHNRSKEDIQQILDLWKPTPAHYIKLDVTSLLQSEIIPEIEMEDISDTEDAGEKQSGSETEIGDDSEKTGFFLKSKWDTDCDEKKLARLDGISKPLQRSQTLEDYLQMDGWEPPTSSSSNNKKRVRWADIEEKRAQDKMRAIGFVVGHTNWDRMMDPTGGRAALTKTKYIEKINKRR